MYINYSNINGIEYGTLTRSIRFGNQIKKEVQTYLGRVIDKELHIFKNKERGLYIYDVDTNTFKSVSPEYEEPKLERKTKYAVRPTLIVSFGDVYLLNEYIKNSGLNDLIDKIGYRNKDTLYALISYYILTSTSNCHAEDWWELTFAKYLFPKAQMSSQRISEALVDIGSKEAKRNFFSQYFQFLKKTNSENENTDAKIEDGILIDSSGLPNSIHFPLTAVNNHNGVINNEIRLIYVVQQHTGLPLFFRYVAGNVIDVNTITRTIAELKANGVNTKFAILDAGYYTNANADVLISAGISFISRMKNNFKLYREIVEKNLNTLVSKENIVLHNKRLVYVKCVPCNIGQNNDKPAYAYLCKDMAIQREEEKHLIEKAEDEVLSGADIFDDLQKKGIFILISTRKIAKENLLPLYYTRDQVEKVFELCKQDGKILPINVENESTFRGHLMMTFISTVILKLISQKLEKSSLTTESMFMNLHEQHAIIYDNEYITTEPAKKMNEAYKIFKIECPISIPRDK